MDKEKIAEVADKVERESRQGKGMAPPDPRTFFVSTYNWLKKAERDEPPYVPQSRVRDQWLREFVQQEPHLASVLSTAVSLDVNRSYTIVGGRNQVLRISDRLANAEGGLGWRILKAKTSRDFYGSDMGSVVEIERDGEFGPLQSLYHVDAARCELTVNPEFPLLYYPQYGDKQAWSRDWFYRFASLTSPDESFNSLGFSAVSRCIKIAQIMMAVVTYDLEKLGHLAPRGLLLLESENLTQSEWDEALAERENIYIRKTGNQYFDNIITIVDRALKGELLELSKLPDNFDPFMFTDYMMKAYALAFNRDVRAFWSVNSGNFGGGTEAQVQYDRATQAGIIDYATNDQAFLQRLLPPTVLFEYDVDDTQGKIMKAELAKLWTEVGKNLTDIGASSELVLSMLVDEAVIDSSWTEVIEASRIDDSNSLARRRERYLEHEQVRRAVNRYDEEPIVEYSYPSNRVRTIWEKGADALTKYFVVPNFRRNTHRARPDGRPAVTATPLRQVLEEGLTANDDQSAFTEKLANAIQLEVTVTEFLNGRHPDNLQGEDRLEYLELMSSPPAVIEKLILAEAELLARQIYEGWLNDVSESDYDNIIRELLKRI